MASHPPTPRPRIGFFGGSFDPPHLGHIGVARAVRERLALDRVLLAPVGLQPMKMRGDKTLITASFADRVAMTRLAVADEPGLDVSLLDAPRADGKPNFTLDALRRLRADQGQHAELFLILGLDAMRGFVHWHQAAEIPFAATLVLVARPEAVVARLETVVALPEADRSAQQPAGMLTERKLGALLPSPVSVIAVKTASEVIWYHLENDVGMLARMAYLPDLHWPQRATEVRARLHATDSHATGAHAIAPRVIDYIHAHHLYR